MIEALGIDNGFEVIRFSFSRYTTANEVDLAASTLKSLISGAGYKIGFHVAHFEAKEII